MKKEELEGLLVDYLDGRLDTATRDLVEEEVSRNPESKKLLDELREVIRVIEHSADLLKQAGRVRPRDVIEIAGHDAWKNVVSQFPAH